MRRVLAPIVCGLTLAGCLSLGSDPVPTSTLPPIGGWALDCALGAVEKGPWAQTCAVRASHTDGPKQEIWLAVNPTNPANVVLGAKDNNPESSNKCTWNGLAVTHDAGQTWKDVVIGGKYAERGPDSPYYGYSCNTDPMFAFGDDGLLHYVVEMYNLAGPDGSGPAGPDPITGRATFLAGWKLMLATSADGGLTWPDVVLLDQSDGVSSINDYSRVTTNPKTGSVITAINVFSGGPFFVGGAAYVYCDVITSRDHGKTADPPVRVVPAQTNPQGLGCATVAASPDGKVLLLSNAGGKVYVATSEDDARSFSEPVEAFAYTDAPGTHEGSEYRTGTHFELRYDLTGGVRHGTLYALWSDGGNGDSDILIRSSPDDGMTWSDPVRVDDDASKKHQWLPNLAIPADGSVHVFFFDKRYDAAGKLIDVTHAVSLDGGATWTNERVTTKSFDGDLGVHQEGFPFIGDYIGVDGTAGEVWVGYPDASDGKTTVMAAARASRV